MTEKLEQNVSTNAVKEEATMAEDTSFAAMLEEYIDESTDQKVVGVVVGVSPSEVEVEIVGRKHTGYVPANEFSMILHVTSQRKLKSATSLTLSL